MTAAANIINSTEYNSKLNFRYKLYLSSSINTIICIYIPLILHVQVQSNVNSDARYLAETLNCNLYIMKTKNNTQLNYSNINFLDRRITGSTHLKLLSGGMVGQNVPYILQTSYKARRVGAPQLVIPN